MKNLTLLLLITFSINSFAQTEYNKLVEEGKTQLQANQLSLALVKFQEAIKLDSSKIDGHYGLGVTQAAICHRQAKFCNEAIETLSYVIKLDSNFNRAYFNRAQCRLNKLDYYNAISDYNKAIELDDTDGDYFADRGFTYQQIGNKEKACLDYQKASQMGIKRAKNLYETTCLTKQ